MAKLKQKTHKGLSKRVKVTASGKVVGRHPGKSHLQSSKTAKRRRRLRRVTVLKGANSTRALKALN